jgi:hypothetical protein
MAGNEIQKYTTLDDVLNFPRLFRVRKDAPIKQQTEERFPIRQGYIPGEDQKKIPTPEHNNQSQSPADIPPYK